MTGIVDSPRPAKAPLRPVGRDPMPPLELVHPSRRKGRGSLVLAAIDLSTASLAVAIGMTWANHSADRLPPSWMMCFFAPTVVALFAIRGLYKRSLNRSFLDELPKIEALTSVAAMLLLSGLVLNPDVDGSNRGPAVAKVWMVAAVLIPLGRLVWFLIRNHQFRRDRLISPTLIVANGRIAAQVVERLEVTPQYGLRPVGLIDDDVPSMGLDRDKPSSIPYLGKLDGLEDVITQTGAQCLIVAFSRTRDDAMTAAVKVAHKRGMAVWIVPRIFDTIGVHAHIDHIGGLPADRGPEHRSARLAVRGQARLRPDVRGAGPAADLAAVPHADAAGPAELSGADLLRSTADRPRRPRLPVPEVPLDAPAERG